MAVISERTTLLLQLYASISANSSVFSQAENLGNRVHEFSLWKQLNPPEITAGVSLQPRIEGKASPLRFGPRRSSGCGLVEPVPSRIGDFLKHLDELWSGRLAAETIDDSSSVDQLLVVRTTCEQRRHPCEQKKGRYKRDV
jgi:hypothetical protein